MWVPESTSVSRVIGFRRSEVDYFFKNLTSALAGVDSSRLFNVDETGLSTVQSQKEQVLAHKGRKQVGKMVNAEKGETITVVCCISASGIFIPPMLIFPRACKRSQVLTATPMKQYLEGRETCEASKQNNWPRKVEVIKKKSPAKNQ